MPNRRKKAFLSSKMEPEKLPQVPARRRPHGLMENEYGLCKKLLEFGQCPMNRFCIFAHSMHELQEWKKRFLQKTTIKVKKTKSHAAKLLEQIATNLNSKVVLSEVPNIVFAVEPDLHSYIDVTPFEIEWKFLLHSYSPMLNVFLLHEDCKENYVITEVTKMNVPEGAPFSKSDDKEWSNTLWESDRQSDSYQYCVLVVFKSAVFGSFKERIIFDFGFYPMLQKELRVDVKQDSDNDSDASESIAFEFLDDDVWSTNNSTIIPYDDTVDENADLLKKYPITSNTTTSDHNTDTVEAYRNKMHYYLNLEEIARFKIISRFTLNIQIETMTSFIRYESLSSYAKYTRKGALFGKITFPSTISEDTEYGKTLLSCTSLYISMSKAENGTRIAYQSTIENFSKSEIYVNLSPKIVSELGLIKDTTIAVDIQFLLNRISYCEMHQSLDRIECFCHLYPMKSSTPIIEWDTYKQFGLLKEAHLNVKQREAVIAMIAPAKDLLPPVVIIGPYGTGKTFTLANAIPAILNDNKNNILICTHSNRLVL